MPPANSPRPPSPSANPGPSQGPSVAEPQPGPSRHRSAAGVAATTDSPSGTADSCDDPAWSLDELQQLIAELKEHDTCSTTDDEDDAQPQPDGSRVAADGAESPSDTMHAQLDDDERPGTSGRTDDDVDSDDMCDDPKWTMEELRQLMGELRREEEGSSASGGRPTSAADAAAGSAAPTRATVQQQASAENDAEAALMADAGMQASADASVVAPIVVLESGPETSSMDEVDEIACEALEDLGLDDCDTT